MPSEPCTSLVSGRRHVLAFLPFPPFLGCRLLRPQSIAATLSKLATLMEGDGSCGQKLCCRHSSLPIILLELDREVGVGYPAAVDETTSWYCFCIFLIEAAIAQPVRTIWSYIPSVSIAHSLLSQQERRRTPALRWISGVYECVDTFAIPWPVVLKVECPLFTLENPASRTWQTDLRRVASSPRSCSACLSCHIVDHLVTTRSRRGVPRISGVSTVSGKLCGKVQLRWSGFGLLVVDSNPARFQHQSAETSVLWSYSTHCRCFTAAILRTCRALRYRFVRSRSDSSCTFTSAIARNSS